jgi:amino acid permease
MWLIFFVVPLAILMLIGSLLAGGIFTIVFLPIALIIVGVAIAFSMYGTSQNRRRLPRDQSTAPAPNTGHSNVPAAPNSPGELTDARRQAQ